MTEIFDRNDFTILGDSYHLTDIHSSDTCSMQVKAINVDGLYSHESKVEKWPYIHAHRVAIGLILIKDEHGKQENDQVVFVRARRIPLEIERGASFCVEFVGGSIGDEVGTETADKTIIKEVAEETGLKLTNVFSVAKNLAVSGHLTSQTFDLFILYASHNSLDDLKSHFPVKQNPYGFSLLRPADNGIVMMLDVIKRKHISEYLSVACENNASIAVSTYAMLNFLTEKY
ncbi:MAG: NUDIX domain-containing protein [Candidatus Caenarcaniphilales bacterium]|nr:NUDIX domain-containing protein [Candidatus Caenarcaniphilales bacterium]